MTDKERLCALVTGGSRGIGAAAAVALGDAGFDVAVNFHHSRRRADAVVEGIRQTPGRALAVAGDFSDKHEISRVYDEVIGKLGRLDVVVNNAAVLPRLPSDADVGEAEKVWDETMRVNAKGVYLSCIRAAKIFQARPETPSGIRGRIINIGSVGGILATPTSPHYGASKAAVHSLTRSFAEKLARHGILVNAVAPGFVDTDMIADLKSIEETVNEQTPLRRWARPEEIAEVVAFLATSAHFVTGQVIQVDGGIGNVYTWIPKKKRADSS